MSWTVIVAMTIGAYLFKVLGVFGLARSGSTGLARRLAPLTALIPAALFAALIVVQTVGVDRAVRIDARAAGLVVAVVAVSRRAPFVVVVAAAMAATGLVRAFTG